MDVQKTLNIATRNRAWIPNSLTSLRIFGAIGLIFLPVTSLVFYVVYALCGVTDVLDGFLARKLHTASSFGAKLDSAADLLFYGVLLLRLLPVLRQRLSAWIWYMVGAILLLRLASYLVVAVRFRRFASTHSIANKLTGASVFGIGLVLHLPWLNGYCCVVCVIGLYSSTQELIVHLRKAPAQIRE